MFVFHCVTAVRCQSGWEVTYSRQSICVVKGWTVYIRCNYKAPAGETVKTYWVKQTQEHPFGAGTYNITMSSQRFTDSCNSKTCTLTIKKTRESDSAVYKLVLSTNSNTDIHTGEPGVTLTVSSETHTSQHHQHIILSFTASPGVKPLFFFQNHVFISLW